MTGVKVGQVWRRKKDGMVALVNRVRRYGNGSEPSLNYVSWKELQGSKRGALWEDSLLRFYEMVEEAS